MCRPALVATTLLVVCPGSVCVSGVLGVWRLEYRVPALVRGVFY